MKKSISLILCLILVFGMVSLTATPVHAAFNVWDGSIATGFAGGSGTASDPYQIKTAAQLAYLAALTGSSGNYIRGVYSLMADLDLNQISWRPIGLDECKFAGTFLGNGHIIKNLYVNEASSDYVGLFGYAISSSISGINVEDAFVRGNECVGVIVGKLNGDVLSNCSVSGTVYGFQYVGGIVGQSGGNLTDCYNAATVSGNGNRVGGIVGYMVFSSQIARCINDGKITSISGRYIGGISGHNGKIYDCLNRGAIIGADEVAGIADSPSNVMNCGNYGSITSFGNAGGIATDLVSDTVTNCFNAGSINGGTGTSDYCGGIAGRAQSTSFTNCWNLSGTAEKMVGYTPSSGYANTFNNVVMVDAMNTQTFIDMLNENLDPYLNTYWARNLRVYNGMPYLPLDIAPLPPEAFVPVITAKSNDSQIFINWDTIDGVTKYSLYKRSYENGAWCTWQTVSTSLVGTSYIDRDVVCGIKYQYRMKGYHGTWSSYSDSVSLMLEPPSPLIITEITTNKTGSAVGETITWTTKAAGGTGTLKYLFNLYKDGTKIKTRSYSTTNTFSYTPTEGGTYKVKVYVKDAADTKVSKNSTSVTVTAAATPAISSVKAGKTSAYAGEKITWTAAASGGSGTLQYYFILYKDGVKIKTRSYSTTKTFSYTPEEAGSYKVKVYVKDSAGTKVSKTSAAVTVTLGPPAILSVKAGKTSSAVGEKLTWTAKAVGSEQPLKYYFILYKDGVKIKTRAYSTTNTFSYTLTEAGTYKVRVYVKDTADNKVNKLSTAVTVTG